MEKHKGKSQTITMLRDAGILFAITLTAGLLLAAVHYVTKEPIAIQNEQAKQSAYQTVMPQAVSFQEQEELTGLAEASKAWFESEKERYNGAYVTEAVAAYDSLGQLTGYVVNVVSPAGYGGDIQLSVGFDMDGKVAGVEILSIKETAGLGMNAKNEAFRNQYVGQEVTFFTVTKTGKQQAGEIDAISCATITSNAVTDAVNAASAFVNEMVLGEVEE